MRIEFYKGVVRSKTGEECGASWGKTSLGLMGFVEGTDGVSYEAFDDVLCADLIAGFDIPGVDREVVEAIVRTVLTGGYLDRPGVRGKGEAVLFMLVNEAIHQLEEIARQEAK
jgi:hypothetical protein